ncbi:hypothetical protein BCS62_05075 [Vibrio cyclitrophicus]
MAKQVIPQWFHLLK